MRQCAFYNEPVAFRLQGSLHVLALEQSLNEIIRRHEIFRTTFLEVEGHPMQVVVPILHLPVPVVDLEMLPEGERTSEVQRFIMQEARGSFDLARRPPIRAAVLRLEKEEHVLLLTTHHIASDGWSKGVFMRELTALYAAFSLGNPSQLLELPIQYADFAVWQREWLQGEAFEASLSYWKQQLAGIPPVLELSTDRARPPVQTFNGAIHSFVLPRALTEALKTLSLHEDVTLFMTLLAAFQVLLSRYSGQEDIVVASPIANRTQTEIEGLIGLFANTLVLRTDLSGCPSFKEVLKRVRKVALEAYAYQDVPFERLVEELHPIRDMSYNPLFQVMFQLQNVPMPNPELAGLTLRQIVIDNKTAKFDLIAMLEDTKQGLIGILEYNADLFDADTIYRMSDHYHKLLEEIATNSDRRLSDFALLTEAEQQQLLVEWNTTATDYPKDLCLHQLFEIQVKQTPEAIAVVYMDVQISYRELNYRANQLAHHLQSLGIGPDVRVGICVERSLDLVIGLMGILKAGGAYLPLDPTYPQDRLAFMLQDAQVPVLLTQHRLLNSLPACLAHVFCLDSDWHTIALAEEDNPESHVTPDNLIYLIYTSGSTGHPKGVMLNHRGRVNNFADFNRRFAVGFRDRVLAISSPSFDMCAYDTLGILMSGGAIVLPDATLERDPAHWVECMIHHKVTIWHSVPALLEMLIEHLNNCREIILFTLRLVLLGGDWISVTLPDRLRSFIPALEIISLGGATESSMDSTIYAVEEIDAAWKSIPYGRPMANQTCYVLDAYLQPVPVGGKAPLSGGRA